MGSVPAVILLTAMFNYHFSHQMMKTRLAHMTQKTKIKKEREALHSLYDLTDSDHSGAISPSELRHILHSLGWDVDVKSAHNVAVAIGGEADAADANGVVCVSEKLFVGAMVSGGVLVSLFYSSVTDSSLSLSLSLFCFYVLYS